MPTSLSVQSTSVSAVTLSPRMRLTSAVRYCCWPIVVVTTCDPRVRFITPLQVWPRCCPCSCTTSSSLRWRFSARQQVRAHTTLTRTPPPPRGGPYLAAAFKLSLILILSLSLSSSSSASASHPHPQPQPRPHLQHLPRTHPCPGARHVSPAGPAELGADSQP